jgi:hypothetical protein
MRRGRCCWIARRVLRWTLGPRPISPPLTINLSAFDRIERAFRRRAARCTRSPRSAARQGNRGSQLCSPHLSGAHWKCRRPALREPNIDASLRANAVTRWRVGFDESRGREGPASHGETNRLHRVNPGPRAHAQGRVWRVRFPGEIHHHQIAQTQSLGEQWINARDALLTASCGKVYACSHSRAGRCYSSSGGTSWLFVQ